MPIFETSPNKWRFRQIDLIGRSFRRGFTLIELLVVLAVGAMLVSLVPVAFDRMREGSQYRETVRALVVSLRQAHHMATARSERVVFQIDLSNRHFGIQGQHPKAFPLGLEVKTTTGSSEEVNGSQLQNIVFLPEGGSTGGTIELKRPSGAGARIKVDWLLGQVTQEATGK